MKKNRMMWVLVTLSLFTTITITLNTSSSNSQQESESFPENTPAYGQDANGYKDLSRYAIADIDAPEPSDETERNKRKLANKRYDGQDWVLKNPHPGTDGVGRDDEVAPPEIIPSDESNLIVVGTITSVTAHMSNDKKAVYSEFAIRIDKIIKNDISDKHELGESVAADRMGGFVQYPNGRKVMYELSDKVLPYKGSQYIFFLTKTDQSPNYKILTLYEFKDNKIVRLDTGRRFDEFEKASKQTFIEAIQNKVKRIQ